MLFLLTAPLAMANQWAGQSIQICDDGAEFAPLTYYKRDGGDKTKELIGSTVELIDLIFRKHNIRYQITLLPWKRCLHEVKYGKNFQLILNAVHTKERAENYLLTQPHFDSKKHYFYSKSKYPQGITINTNRDFEQYSLGGVRGYAQTVFGVEDGQVEFYTHSYGNLIEMMYLNRFDVFLAGEELYFWLRLTRPDLAVNNKLGYGAINYLPDTDYHMLISKGYSKAEELKELIDRELDLMRESGQLQGLKEKYFH
ncbi:transporter substrate-binding domain-containing protein [Endozoicomonas sp. G2_1]|uniref:substrate-binding periplasmic protein n=1 Tax=Endozoicomonas sp. G2_1 TaxID=2821091 RepID=UPI001ADC1848|nr:ABC transporter substrate-binding protein [Endozoicomonas sp. G2_1]MBO9488857.1 transporter substrate-binding domain-containing protein [Endozoicomonas sp. G2_1]